MEENKRNLLIAVNIGLLICSTFFALLALVFVVGISGRLTTDEGLFREMRSELSVANGKLDDMAQAPEETEPAESSSSAEEAPSYTQEELNDMVFSRNFDDLLTVASSPNATELQLTLIAQECVTAIGSDIDKLMSLVVALVSNPNCTTTIVTMLANVNYYEVWLVVAQSDLCSEATLLLLAEQCSPYGNYDSNFLVPVVSAICENDSISIYVIQVLNNNYYACIQDIVRAKKIELLQPEILETLQP